MPDWLQAVLSSILGGTISVVGIFTIFKNMISTIFEKALANVFEKDLEKYRNNFLRSNKAYEMLLEKELQFYTTIDPHLAKLIPLMHDFVDFYSTETSETPEEKKQKYLKLFRTYINISNELKNQSLIYQSYIPDEIFKTVTKTSLTMQDSFELWYSSFSAYITKQTEFELSECEKHRNEILWCVAENNFKIKNRLEELSKFP